MRTIVRLFAGVVFTAAMAVPSHAGLVEWTFSALVRDIDGNAAGMAEYGITGETILSATFVLDNSVPGEQIAANVWFNGAVVGIEMSAGIFDASLDTEFPVFNSVVVRDYDFDVVSASASLVISNGTDSTIGFAALQFVGSDGLLINNTLFPSLPDFSHVDDYDTNVLGAGGTFLSFQASVGGVFTTVKAEIFSPEARLLPVPIPGAIFLFGGALLALMRLSR